ncbi:MAG: hypothetical protein GY736_22840, partial [Sphingomonas sp.]|uniref:hypothetical protein n=1 Tax=Sphingomonas sp. TaxID=28214 RepID=UPI002585CA87
VENVVQAYVDASDVSTSVGGIDITADSDADLISVALGAAASTGEVSYAGTLVTNTILNTVDASVRGSGSVVTAPGDINVKALDESHLDIGAGGIAGSTWQAGGAAFVFNSIVSNDTDAGVAGGIKARVEDAHVTSDTGSVEVKATSDTEIISAAVGAAVATGPYAGAGSVAANTIAKRIDAKIENSADIDAGADIRVVAKDTSAIHVGTGGFAVSTQAGGAAIGAA